jgi:formylglycine-generating enzyme required for sulfatase activity
MGSNDYYPEERPVHRVTVDGFWIDQCPVTNREFRQFVESAGYKTVAESVPDPAHYPGVDPASLTPGSLVFQMPRNRVSLRDYRAWWRYVPGACWKRPEGADSDLAGRDDHPVVHIANADAEAYALWAGKSLPTEAEWEFAARGGLEAARFVWGNEVTPEGRLMANTWQGEFPWQNLKLDGYEGTSPVHAFPPNGYGLYDMAGNVWEWTSDFYRARHPDDAKKACCVPCNPRVTSVSRTHEAGLSPEPIPRKVLKGGSYLCAPNYCLRYRPAARQGQAVDTSACHIGFRCVLRGSVHE